MTVTLTPEQEKFIEERVRRGEYPSAEIIVNEGLKLVLAKEEYQRRLVRLRAEINVGVEQIKRGEVVDGETAIENIRKKLRQRERTANREAVSSVIKREGFPRDQ